MVGVIHQEFALCLTIEHGCPCRASWAVFAGWEGDLMMIRSNLFWGMPTHSHHALPDPCAPTLGASWRPTSCPARRDPQPAPNPRGKGVRRASSFPDTPCDWHRVAESYRTRGWWWWSWGALCGVAVRTGSSQTRRVWDSGGPRVSHRSRPVVVAPCGAQRRAPLRGSAQRRGGSSGDEDSPTPAVPVHRHASKEPAKRYLSSAS